jgi:hypothetical protein
MRGCLLYLDVNIKIKSCGRIVGYVSRWVSLCMQQMVVNPGQL